MEYISPREYADRTGQHWTQVYRKIKTGLIPHKKMTKELIRIPWTGTKKEKVN
jgi:hypothetical protein